MMMMCFGDGAQELNEMTMRIRVEDARVGDVFDAGHFKAPITEILRGVKSCRHGVYPVPQIVLHYENQAWGNNWAEGEENWITVDRAAGWEFAG